MLSMALVSLLGVVSCSSGASAGSKAANVSGTARASGARRIVARMVRMVDTCLQLSLTTWVKNVGAPWNAQLIPCGGYSESVG